MEKITAEIKPHSLNKSGNADYCIVSLCLDIDGHKYYDNHSLYLKYVLDQGNSATQLLEEVVNTLNNNFVRRFECNDIENAINVKTLIDDMKILRKRILDSQK